MQSEIEKKINQTAFENLTRQKNDLAERVIRLEDVNAALRSENERLNNYVIGGYNEMLDEAAKRLEDAEKALEFYANYMNYSVDYDTSNNGFSRRCILYSDIEERNEATGLAGKRAREYFEKYKTT